jgi:hypothetical protein
MEGIIDEDYDEIAAAGEFYKRTKWCDVELDDVCLASIHFSWVAFTGDI